MWVWHLSVGQSHCSVLWQVGTSVSVLRVATCCKPGSDPFHPLLAPRARILGRLEGWSSLSWSLRPPALHTPHLSLSPCSLDMQKPQPGSPQRACVHTEGPGASRPRSELPTCSVVCTESGLVARKTAGSLGSDHASASVWLLMTLRAVSSQGPVIHTWTRYTQAALSQSPQQPSGVESGFHCKPHPVAWDSHLTDPQAGGHAECAEWAQVHHSRGSTAAARDPTPHSCGAGSPSLTRVSRLARSLWGGPCGALT